ncbi:hypothetical protein FM076_30080 [Streptomyces albus subsp. chlorinus]|uniref:MAC/perforin domain-containing protein n=1 Tax=Streptomyces albus TaxID=1888 RepID=UPI00156EB533|nr:MAC/perforin domain-containing protein [Streptomyces albus]NSC25180.1 hypothetical protein [Streptomyces albus subsp. chlorinus]
MSEKLVKVKNTNGNGRGLKLDTDAFLTDTRSKLTTDTIMGTDDDFLLDDTPLARDIESSTKLSEALDKEEDDKLYIGKIKGSVNPDGGEKWFHLSSPTKRDVLDQLGVFRGRTPGKRGLTKTFKNVCAAVLPDANQPDISSEKATTYRFSEFTRHLEISGVNSASVQLTTPFGDAKAEYEHESKKSKDGRTATEHLVTRFTVRKVILKHDLKKVKPNADFAKAVDDALDFEGDQVTEDHYKKLMKVLEEWGFYVPAYFTLGGLIHASDTTDINEYAQAEKERRAFGGSVAASFRGIGAGADYKKSSGNDNADKKQTKYKDTVLMAIGGSPITSHDDYSSWAESLNYAKNWAVIEHNELYPSLYLLWQDVKYIKLQSRVWKTLVAFARSKGQWKPIHEYVDMVKYGERIFKLNRGEEAPVPDRLEAAGTDRAAVGQPDPGALQSPAARDRD